MIIADINIFAGEQQLDVRGLGPKLAFLYERAILPTTLPAFIESRPGPHRDSALARTRLARREVDILARVIERQRGVRLAPEDVAASPLVTFEARLLATEPEVPAPLDAFTNTALLEAAAARETAVTLRPADAAPGAPNEPRVFASGADYVFEVGGLECFVAKQAGPVEDLLVLFVAQADCEIAAGETVCEALWLPAAVEDRLFWPVPGDAAGPLACPSEPLHLTADFAGRPCVLTVIVARRRALPAGPLPDGACIGATRLAAICTHLRAAAIGRDWTAAQLRFSIDRQELPEGRDGGVRQTMEDAGSEP